MSRATICLLGNNLLINEAIQQILKSKGFEAHSGDIDSFFGDNLIFSLAPDVIIWEERLLESRGSTIFDLWRHNEKSFRSVFILSKESMQFLGLGLTNGIEGFVHIKGGLEELEKCLVNVLRGSVFISPLLAGSHAMNGQKKEELNGNSETDLTDQEEKILRFVKLKKTSREIGRILNISYKTVQNHRQNMCNKLGLRGRNKLFEFAKAYFD